MKKEQIRLEDIRFRTEYEIIIPDASPADVSEVARAMADELERTLVDRITGSTFEQRGALWLPASWAEASPWTEATTFTKDEIAWRFDSRDRSAETTSIAPALSFEDIARIMDDLKTADPFAEFRAECEVMISAWLDDAFVIDREAGSTDAWYRDFRAFEDVKRFLVIVPSLARIGEDVRTKLQALSSYMLTDDDIVTSIAYLAYEEAKRQRAARASAGRPPAWGLFPILKVFNFGDTPA